MRLSVAKASAAFNKLIELGAWGGPLKSVGSTLVSQMGLSMASCSQRRHHLPLPGLNWALSAGEWFATADLKNDFQSPGKERYSTDSRQYMEGGQNASCEPGWLAELKSRVLHLLTGTAGQLNLSASVSSSVKWG